MNILLISVISIKMLCPVPQKVGDVDSRMVDIVFEQCSKSKDGPCPVFIKAKSRFIEFRCADRINWEKLK